MPIRDFPWSIPAPAHFAGWLGVGRREITPPVGIYARNWGAARHDQAERIHRPLTATVSALSENEQSPAALVVSLDLGWWKSRDDEHWVRGILADAAGIPVDRVFLNLSHTHAGPSIHLGDLERPGGDRIPEYRRLVESRLREAVADAIASCEPVVARWSEGRDPVSVNRDMPDPDAPEQRCLVGWNPDSDPTPSRITVGRFCRPDGTPIAAWVQVACHPTTLGPGNRAISPDFPGALRETVESVLDVPCQFLQGASGDRAPIEQYSDNPEVCDRHGRSLGYAALAAWFAMPPAGAEPGWCGAVDSGAALGVWIQKPSAAATGIACQTVRVELAVKPSVDAVPGELGTPAARERHARVEQLRHLIGPDRPFVLEIPVWRIGTLHLCGIPGESYSAMANQLRERAVHGGLMVCNCTNGWYGYLPPRGIYALPNVYPALQSPFEPGCHEEVADRLSAWLAEPMGTAA